MSIFKTMVIQVSKPTGLFGKVIAIGMNFNHKRLTDWGLNGVNIGRDFIILDIGCGGGATIQRLSKVAIDGKIYGIDISNISVQSSTKKNQHLIKKGKVEITEGSVSSLPFQNNFFDLITGINTHIFWPDLKNGMKEVLRALKPNGILLTRQQKT
jgi:ubiquinone/menaquinone biosynthesis C-methylase UbiE